MAVLPGFGPKGSQVTLAYCTNENSFRIDYSNTEVRWYTFELAKGMTRLYESVRVIAVAPEEKYIAKKYRTKSFTDEELWLMLGLDADFRLCWFGQTSVVETIKRLRNATLLRHTFEMNESSLWTSEARMVSLPRSVKYVGDPVTKARVGPVNIRMCFEPWLQFVEGVEIQLETKRETLPSSSIAVYAPFGLVSIGRRLGPISPSEPLANYQKRHGCCIPDGTGVEEVVFRRGLFDINTVLRHKRYFASFLQSHCHQYRHTTAIRTAFAFELAAKARPVSSLGHCPKGDAVERLGVPNAERLALIDDFQRASAITVHSEHKFAIVFENGPCDGYISEKIVDAYLAHSVPIYFGPDKFSLNQVLNPSAYVHCDIPSDMVSDKALNKAFKAMCPDSHSSTCQASFDSDLQERLSSHFAPCIDRIKRLDADPVLYKEALEAPLAAHGELAGVWNFTYTAKVFDGIRSILLRSITNVNEASALFGERAELPMYYFPQQDK
ncbi:Alpha-1,3-fucosyltransferase B [Hondaea fermentalgiana]|uniref:Fucosyltransferase n=1 Tax=Hondaea fermentalgiana TaxID=2315210 RepID=A0A2R5H1Z0_9STRA|nr:Alpha-1,3-fucosyltransferase B [Hondaea fermentalgiana]|eukprot:GBG34384.1 Alpha-1,3-fucosyltransferase B [Hondaea fermentalgiana]